jgi:hypothetical protein
MNRVMAFSFHYAFHMPLRTALETTAIPIPTNRMPNTELTFRPAVSIALITIAVEKTVAVILWHTRAKQAHKTTIPIKNVPDADAGTKAVKMDPKNKAAIGLVRLTSSPVKNAFASDFEHSFSNG